MHAHTRRHYVKSYTTCVTHSHTIHPHVRAFYCVTTSYLYSDLVIEVVHNKHLHDKHLNNRDVNPKNACRHSCWQLFYLIHTRQLWYTMKQVKLCCHSVTNSRSLFTLSHNQFYLIFPGVPVVVVLVPVVFTGLVVLVIVMFVVVPDIVPQYKKLLKI